MAAMYKLLCCCAIVTVASAGITNRYSWKSSYSKDAAWMMLPDNEGNPTLALLTERDPHPRALNLTRDVHFMLYTKSNVNSAYRLYVGDANNLHSSPFNSQNPTKFVIHGFTNNINSPVIQDIKNAYLSVGSYNVIGVDWGVLADAPWYTSAKDHVIPVGQYVGKMIDFLGSAGGQATSKVHLIGHSLGAHVSGMAGSSATGTVARVTGLDTALPLYEDDSDSVRLDASDARFVDVIHTCGGWLGFMDVRGHVDFYPNGGVSIQPGCGVDLTGSCSHGRSYEFFTSSISNHNLYPGHKCGSVADAERGNCDSGTSGYMGDGVSTTLRGIYWMSTK